ncbi:MAG: hypothetical protein F6K65_42225, partial [Moorea sp. SIO3C2]|nr:hypothetical protein [Moorena sp. SIO3C2]
WDLTNGKVLSRLAHITRRSKVKVIWKVYAIAVSLDDQWLIAGCQESLGDSNAIIIWNLRTKKLTKKLDGHTAPIIAIAFTPDGKRFISASLDKTIKVWDTKSGKELLTLTGHNDSIYDVTITPDCKTLISTSKDKTLKAWNLDSEQNNITLIDDEKSVNDVTLTLDGKQVIFGLKDNSFSVYNLEKNKPNLSWSGNQDQYMFSFAPNQYQYIINIAICLSFFSSQIAFWIIPIIGLIISFILHDIIAKIHPVLILLPYTIALIIASPHNFFNNQNIELKKSTKDLNLKSHIKASLLSIKNIAISVTRSKNFLICVNRHLTFWDLNNQNHSFDLLTKLLCI